MRYLITGGTGFIGSALVKRLVRDGEQVRVLDNDLRGAKTRLQDVMKHVDMVEADVRDAKAVRKACRQIDSVVHLAYVNGTKFFYTDPDLVLDIGVKGTVNVIDACKAEGVKVLALASSSEVYQTPPSVPTDECAPLSIPDVLNPRYSYGGGKIISELLVINNGRKHFERSIIFRPHNVYGADMGFEHVIPQFILRLKALSETCAGIIDFPIQGTGRETRSFVYIDDFINGLMLVLQKGEHLNIYHIGNTDEITIADLGVKVGQYFGRKIRIVPGTLPKGGTSRRCPDITKLKKLGYCPHISLDEGLLRTASWYTSHAESRMYSEANV